MTNGSTSPTGAAIPTSAWTARDRSRARCSRSCARSGRARARARLAFAPGPGPLQRAGEPAPRRDGERRGRRSAARRAGAAAGSHHQKLVVVRRPNRPDDDVAFVGGIDLCHGRNDTEGHEGDPQPVEIDPRYGDRPAWHDVQLEVHGPAVGDLAFTFRERWEDPTPVDHRNPVRGARRAGGTRAQATGPDAADASRPGAVRSPRGAGRPHVSRPSAALSVRARGRAQHRARVPEGVPARRAVGLLRGPVPLVRGCRRRTAPRRSGAHPELRLVAVVPRHPDRDGKFSGPPYRIGRERVFERVCRRRPRPGRRVRPRERRRHFRSMCTPRSASSTTCG